LDVFKVWVEPELSPCSCCITWFMKEPATHRIRAQNNLFSLRSELDEILFHLLSESDQTIGCERRFAFTFLEEPIVVGLVGIIPPCRCPRVSELTAYFIDPRDTDRFSNSLHHHSIGPVSGRVQESRSVG